MPSLHELRVRAPMSLRELATKADVSLRTLVLAEQGRRVPVPATMRRIADALGISVAEIDEFAAAIDAAVEKKAAA